MRDRSMALVVRGHKILSVQTHRSGRYINELPGGGIEPGETAEEAALRELKEECGLIGTISRQLNILNRKDGSTEYVYLVDVSSEQRETIGSDPEIQEGAEQAIKNVRWLSLDEFTERERAYLWSYGLLDVEDFHDAVWDMAIEHIAMYVNDLEAARAFFTTYLGAVSNSGYHNPATGFHSYFLSFGGGARLELMNKPHTADPEKPLARTGYIHIAFSLGSAEKVDELTARLKADGFPVVSGPRTTGDGYYESCVVGIEGNQIELTV